jgi:hypothetical protein
MSTPNIAAAVSEDLVMNPPNYLVMAGHSRSKNGVASLAYVPAIHVVQHGKKGVDARDKPAHDG